MATGREAGEAAPGEEEEQREWADLTPVCLAEAFSRLGLADAGVPRPAQIKSDTSAPPPFQIHRQHGSGDFGSSSPTSAAPPHVA